MSSKILVNVYKESCTAFSIPDQPWGLVLLDPAQVPSQAVEPSSQAS